jgi:tRNA (adenine37-N6)-methyltransferase
MDCTPIGVVRNAATEAVDEGWGDVVSTIVLEPQLAPGLAGLDDFSHVVVVYALHEAAFDPAQHLHRRPRGMADMPEIGIFAQRARHRPNRIGVTTVALVSVEPGGIVVRGLDAIDGTPVLDIKPHVPVYDSPADVHTPAWIDTLMEDYF